MRVLGRLIKRLIYLVLLCAIALAAPIIYVETMCRPNSQTEGYEPLLPEAYHRPESRTLMTYPEWHIVHAYDDYAEVIKSAEPHDFAYFRAISQFWGSLCTLNEQAGSMGGTDASTKQMIYVIGTSFTAELALKAAYEETIGRVFTMIRGPERSPLDDLSAEQAAGYARFLQQVPWYRWDFRGDVAALEQARTDAIRDQERRFALGAEFSVKAAYARLIEQAVASVGNDELKLRMVVSGATDETLNAFDGVESIGPRGSGTEIETIRYRALTGLLNEMAGQGIDFVEIAGNDDIMLTVTSAKPELTGAMLSLPRQGYGDTRHLLRVKVTNLAELLRTLPETSAVLEHIHDY